MSDQSIWCRLFHKPYWHGDPRTCHAAYDVTTSGIERLCASNRCALCFAKQLRHFKKLRIDGLLSDPIPLLSDAAAAGNAEGAKASP